MTWQPDIDELERRKQLAYRLGGEERVKRHHDRGRLTVRERLDLLLDPGTLRERGVLAGKAEYEDGELRDFTPSNFVMGTGKIDGRPIVVGGDDFTVRGGAADGAVGGKGVHAERMALELKIPMVRLVDGTGGGGSVTTIESIGRTYVPSNATWPILAELLSTVPVAAAAMGSVAGRGAAQAITTHFTVMIRGQSQLFAAGPPVVQRGLGLTIDREDLGGSHIHVHGSGAVDNEADDEADAFRQIARFLCYLPDNVWQLPPVTPCDDPVDRRDEELLSLIPRDRRQPHDVRRMLAAILDRDSIFEMRRYFGPGLVTCFGRLDGRPVGVIANDPMYAGGALDGDGADKMTKFVDLCDTFNMPIVNFVDQPGFMLGVAAERSGSLKRGVRAFVAVNQAVVPWASVLVHRAFGAAHQNHTRWNYRVAWPSGEWGSLPIEGGVMAAYRRQIEGADDPEAFREEIEQRLTALGSPFRTAEAFNIEEIIDPRDTRPLLCEWLELAYQSLKTIAGPKARGMRP
jgi:acetyl-CoA carboxylase carboxyltransferase component